MRKYLILINFFTITLTNSCFVISCKNNKVELKSTTNKIKNRHLELLADQTSSLIKALIMSKELEVDTSETIQDILNEYTNLDIKNQSTNTNLKSWTELENAWGFNHQINTIGFDPHDYFTNKEIGTFTKKISLKKTSKNILSELKSTLETRNINSKKIKKLLQDANVKETIINYLNWFKNLNQKRIKNPVNLEQKATNFLKKIKKIIGANKSKEPNYHAFAEKIINPLNSFLNYSIDGQWSSTQLKTPINSEELKNFMTNWKDKDQVPYSSWHDGTSWKLDKDYYKNWNQKDYEFLRAGTLLNYVFYKIGKENNISQPGKAYKDRRLNDIIYDHWHNKDIFKNTIRTLFSKGTFDKKDLNPINQKTLSEDLEQYLPHLLNEPENFLLLLEIIIPIIKQWGIKMDDITKSTQNLEFTNLKSTAKKENNYNILEILKNFEHLLNNPKKLEEIIKSLIGWTSEPRLGRTFLYDIKINLTPFHSSPLTNLINSTWSSNELKEEMVSDVIKALTNEKTKKTFNKVLTNFEKFIIEKIKEYKEDGISIYLKKIQEILLNKENGLLLNFNKNIIPTLCDILTNPEPVTNEEYLQFTEVISSEFLNKLKNNFKENNIPLEYNSILFSTIFEPITNFINSSNENINDFIKNKYKNFFDLKNKRIAKISNIKIKNENNLDQISYDFNYQINNKNYYFTINCCSNELSHNQDKLKNFYFTDIKLNKIKILSNLKFKY